jgi:hypothetical protein
LKLETENFDFTADGRKFIRLFPDPNSGNGHLILRDSDTLSSTPSGGEGWGEEVLLNPSHPMQTGASIPGISVNVKETSPYLREIAFDRRETRIYIREIDPYTREIGNYCREMTIYRREIEAYTREIDRDRPEIETCGRELSSYTPEIAADRPEIDRDTPEIAAEK